MILNAKVLLLRTHRCIQNPVQYTIWNSNLNVLQCFEYASDPSLQSSIFYIWKRLHWNQKQKQNKSKTKRWSGWFQFYKFLVQFYFSRAAFCILAATNWAFRKQTKYDDIHGCFWWFVQDRFADRYCQCIKTLLYKNFVVKIFLSFCYLNIVLRSEWTYLLRFCWHHYFSRKNWCQSYL